MPITTWSDPCTLTSRTSLCRGFFLRYTKHNTSIPKILITRSSVCFAILRFITANVSRRRCSSHENYCRFNCDWESLDCPKIDKGPWRCITKTPPSRHALTIPRTIEFPMTSQAFSRSRQQQCHHTARMTIYPSQRWVAIACVKGFLLSISIVDLDE